MHSKTVALLVSRIYKEVLLGNFLMVLLVYLFPDFRLHFLSALDRSANSSSRGLYIDSCFAHCQTETQQTWFMADSPVLSKKVRDRNFFFLSMIINCLLLTFSWYPCQAYKNWFLSCSWKHLMQKIAKAVGDWFYDRTPFQKIDCSYPCNPTCHNRVLAHHPAV